MKAGVPISRIIRAATVWALITLAWCALVISLSTKLRAQGVYCLQIDRFGFLCVPSTGEIFVENAAYEEQWEWIHKNRAACCNHRDCKPAVVKWTPRGWQIEGANNLIPEKDVIQWPFGEPFACIDGRYARCLFMSTGG